MKISVKQLKKIIEEELGVIQEAPLDESALDAMWATLEVEQKAAAIAVVTKPPEGAPPEGVRLS